MTLDQAVRYARKEADQHHRNMIISLNRQTMKWTVQHCCDAKLDGYDALYRIEPTDRHWNGSRLIESQPLIRLTDGAPHPV